MSKSIKLTKFKSKQYSEHISKITSLAISEFGECLLSYQVSAISISEEGSLLFPKELIDDFDDFDSILDNMRGNLEIRCRADCIKNLVTGLEMYLSSINEVYIDSDMKAVNTKVTLTASEVFTVGNFDNDLYRKLQASFREGIEDGYRKKKTITRLKGLIDKFNSKKGFNISEEDLTLVEGLIELRNSITHNGPVYLKKEYDITYLKMIIEILVSILKKLLPQILSDFSYKD